MVVAGEVGGIPDTSGKVEGSVRREDNGGPVVGCPVKNVIAVPLTDAERQKYESQAPVKAYGSLTGFGGDYGMERE